MRWHPWVIRNIKATITHFPFYQFRNVTMARKGWENITCVGYKWPGLLEVCMHSGHIQIWSLRPQVGRVSHVNILSISVDANEFWSTLNDDLMIKMDQELVIGTWLQDKHFSCLHLCHINSLFPSTNHHETASFRWWHLTYKLIGILWLWSVG